MKSQNVLYSLPRPTVIAHRGASAYAPENTIAAFELAVRQGADAIELDAKLTSDGAVVVIHDQTVDRTTPGQGRVSEMTLAELKKLDAGRHFDIDFTGEPIPTLGDVFEALGGKILINIELTNYASKLDHLPDKVCALVKKHGLSGHIIFSSFNPIALLRARRILPEVPIGLLCLDGKQGQWARSWIGALIGYDALHPYYMDANQGLVETIHKNGKRVYAYTVNQADDLVKLINTNIDGIFTDDPILALKLSDRIRV